MGGDARAGRSDAVSESARVVVVGGGLAGMAAALACADGGADVTLLEAKKWLGGATSSFARDGLTIDTGQQQAWTCRNGHTWSTTKQATDAHGGWIARYTTGVEKNT